MKSSMLIALLFLSAAALAQPPEGMVLIEGGTFHMGIEGGKDNPRHEVTVSSFYMDATEVTNAEYKAFCEANKRTLPIFWGMDVFRSGDDWPDHPIVGVSHSAAKAYAEWAGKRLPTEAEWEYACRAGTTTRWICGKDPADLGEYAWFRDNAGMKTHPVGEKKPNAYGLHDMHGNVSERCADWQGPYTSEEVSDPSGPETGDARVHRGGAWCFGERVCQSPLRSWLEPTYRFSSLGFRVVLVLADEQTKQEQAEAE